MTNEAHQANTVMLLVTHTRHHCGVEEFTGLATNADLERALVSDKFCVREEKISENSVLSEKVKRCSTIKPAAHY